MEPHGGVATARRAIGGAAELAGRDGGLQVGRDGSRGLSEGALPRTAGRIEEFPDQGFRHVQLRELPAQIEHVRHGLSSLAGREHLRQVVAQLGREDAEPDLAHLGPGSPEPQEVLQVAGPPHHLCGDSAVNDDLLAPDVFQDSLVSGRGAAGVVLGLESIDGDGDAHPAEGGPLRWEGAEGAGDDLHVDAARGEPRHQDLQFAEAHERVAADQGDVQRPGAVGQLQHPVDERLSLVVAQLPQRDLTAEVLGVVGVAAGAVQGALPGDFDGKGRDAAPREHSPGTEDVGDSHPGIPFRNAIDSSRSSAPGAARVTVCDARGGGNVAADYAGRRPGGAAGAAPARAWPGASSTSRTLTASPAGLKGLAR
jgi:hypothetical protein